MTPQDDRSAAQPLERLADEPYCYLTTTGRVTGRPHTIEIWFGASGRTVYMLSGGGDRADWVRNLRWSADAAVRIGERTFRGTGRVVTDRREDVLARRLLVEKYQSRTNDDLSQWGRTALPVAVDLDV